MAVDPDRVRDHLRHHGVTVHHATSVLRDPQDGQVVVVVFLEGARSQHEQAETLARQLDGVTDVQFPCADTQAIMYVVAA